MPVAFSVVGLSGSSLSPGGLVASSWERSRVPLDFLAAVLALAPLGVARWDSSSAARRASRSAFFCAAAAFFSASASLFWGESEVSCVDFWCLVVGGGY